VRALLREVAEVRIAEEALELALHGGIALLHFGAALLKTLFGVGLGAARGATDAIAARAATHEDDDVARGGLFTAHLGAGGGAHHGADFHALGHVAGIVDLGDLARGEADLIAVRGEAVCGLGIKLARLQQLL